MIKLSQQILFFIGLMLPQLLFGGTVINYKVGNDKFQGYLEKTKHTSKGTVIIIHDWDGLTDYEIKRTQMLAKSGYDAFAIDLYGKGVRPVETKMKKAEVGKLYKDREKMRRRILGSLKEADKYVKGDRVVIGYCFGGAATLELSRFGKAKNLKGFATFHGGLETPEGQEYTKSAPIFIAHGGADKSITMDHVAALSKELEKVGITYDIEVYSGAPHAFTVFGSPAYRSHADQKSWNSFMGFLQKSLK